MKNTKTIPLWLWLMALLTTMGPLSIDMYLPAFPSISSSLGAPQEKVELTVAAYLFGLAFAQLIYGPVSDRFGRKRPLLVGLVLYIIASIACGFVTSVEGLTLFRALQAFGGAAGMVIPRAVIRDHYNTKDAAQALSILMLIMGVAPIIAPLVGGQLSPITGWRGLFVVMVLFAGFIFFMIAKYFKESMPKEKAVALRPSIIAKNYFGLLSHLRFMCFALSGGLGMAGMFAYISTSPTILISQYGVSPGSFGWFFGANAVGLIGSAQINAYFLRRNITPIRILRWAILGGLISVFLGIMATLLGYMPLWLVMLCLFSFMCSLGFINPNAAALALSEQGNRLGAASALMGCMQFLFGTLTSAIASHWSSNSPLTLLCVLLSCLMLSWVCGFLAEKSQNSLL